MGSAITQMLIYLSAAAVLGFAAGWFARRIPALRQARSLNNRLADKDHDFQSMQKRLAAGQKKIHGIEEQLRKRKLSMDESNTQLRALEANLAARDKDLARSRAELEGAHEQIGAHEAEITTARKRIRTLDATVMSREETMKEMSAHIEAYRSKQRGLKSETNDLESKVVYLERAVTTKDTEISQVEDWRGRFHSLEPKYRRGEQQIAELRAEIESLQRERASMSAPAFLLKKPPQEIDDLKRISGIGPVLERTLNDLGVYQFRQIAGFGPSEIYWLSSELEVFPGRIERDEWVDQAKGLTAHSER